MVICHVGPTPSVEQQRRLHEHLLQGLPAIVRCDTIYGLVGLPGASERLRQLKGRDQRPFIQLLGSFEQLRQLVIQPVPAKLLGCWPGPLSCVLRTTTGDQALRIPSSGWLRHLIVQLAQPLLSTSVNFSGQPALHRVRDIVSQFSAPDLLLWDSGKGGTTPSTLVDARSLPLKVLRPGAMEVEDLLPDLFRE